ncbi:hypothetical protein HJC23_004349 [Cyclotella cryptica]|uniref:Uncharacterized protein n=1 Tax=Cyclotella cryptica TaxID=29204 RepID=A0ABD3NYD2_9STRA
MSMVNLSPLTDTTTESHSHRYCHEEQKQQQDQPQRHNHEETEPSHNPPLHMLHLLSSSNSNTIDANVVVNMREFDADILELGVEEKRREDLADFDENGRRSVRTKSFSSLPEEISEEETKDACGCCCCCEEEVTTPRDDDDDDEKNKEEEQSTVAVVAEPPISSRTTSYKTLKSGGGSVHSMPQIAEDSTSSHPLLHEEKHDDDYYVGTSATGPDDEQVDHAALALRRQAGRHLRSDSFERRSRESAQFAEAVGENSNLMLNKIIEEDSSSDFDDDDIDEVEEKEGGVDHVVVGEREKEEEEEDGERAPQPSPIHVVVTTTEQHTSTSTPASSPIDHIVQSLRISSLAVHPPFIDWKFTRQYSSSANTLGTSMRDNEKVPDEELLYKGIRASQLEITQRGVSRGNYAQLHRKAWLEVSDKHHRYGKNLRMYYKHWEGLGHPFSMFFDWLDSKGEAEGQPLPNLTDCPRSVLDSDTVLYITDPEVSASYALEIAVDPADGSAIVLECKNRRPVRTGKEGWIFVLRDHVLYGSQKVTSPGGCVGSSLTGEEPLMDVAPPVVRQRFHHSSFFGGKAVASAGIFLTNDQGRLTDLWPHSGHYRPGEAHMQRALFFLQQKGVDLSTFEVDMQQIFKVCRKKSPKEKEKKKEENSAIENGGEDHQQSKEANQPKKAKKTECLLNMGGLEVACFLAHKARMIEKGVFYQVHKIRRLPHELRSSVNSVLDFVNRQ